MTKWIRMVCVGFLFGGATLFFSGCEGVAYTEGEPGGVYYGYDYYPDADVYYYPEDHVYYWYDDGDWHHGPGLPPAYHLHGERYEHLRLRGREPWMYHHPEHREFERHYEQRQRPERHEREEHREHEEHEGGGAFHYHHD